MNFPKCLKCGYPNYTEQAFGKCDLCYDCCEELKIRKEIEHKFKSVATDREIDYFVEQRLDC